MGILDFFKRKEKEPEETCSIALSCEPTPDNAVSMAQTFVDLWFKHIAEESHYTVESLSEVDVLIEEARQSDSTRHKVSTFLFLAGCYVGEVLVRHYNFKWIESSEAGIMGEMSQWPLFLEKPNDTGISNPIGKAFKRYDNGEEDSLAFFVKVVTTQAK